MTKLKTEDLTRNDKADQFRLAYDHLVKYAELCLREP